MVEGLLSGLSLEDAPRASGSSVAAADGGSATAASSSGAGIPSAGDGQGEEGGEPAAALLDELLLLGFGEGHARRAVAACGGRGASLPAALDWLCLNVPEDELPVNFAPGEGAWTNVLLPSWACSEGSFIAPASAHAAPAALLARLVKR